MAREDTMPHERGPPPMLPFEFTCPVRSDPKARFLISLARTRLASCRPARSRSKPLNQIDLPTAQSPLKLKNGTSPSSQRRRDPTTPGSLL
jgi:hypothetical protein